MALHARDVEQDVRELSTLLGEHVAEQATPVAFDAVERVRTEAIDYRRGDVDSRGGLRAGIGDLDPETEETVARAFTTDFELTNLAEERERVRTIRSKRDDGTLADSLVAAVERFAAADADPETVRRVLADTLVQPTFTAHPTEARRKTVKAKLRSVADHVETLDERRLTDLGDRALRLTVKGIAAGMKSTG